MIAKKTDKGNLENKRGLFLLVGFAVVLGLVYAGFELFASEDKAPAFVMEDDDFITVVDDDVIATDQTPPPPQEQPQQQQEVVLNIVEDNIKVNTELTFDVEFNEDEAIADVGDEEVEVVEEVGEDEPPAEVVISYVKDLGKKLIQTEQDFANFISNKIGKLDLDISQTSRLYKENFNTLKNEEVRDLFNAKHSNDLVEPSPEIIKNITTIL